MLSSARLSRRSRLRGVSVLELLVSVVVLGIAIAGMTELVWLGASWVTSLNNRMDNFIAIRFFFNRFERDVHNCYRITSGTAQKLEMQCLNKSAVDANNFPSNPMDSIIYEIVSDGSDYKIQMSRNGTLTTVLRGINGPTSASTTPHVFQYVKRYTEGDTNLGVIDSVSQPVSEVIINLQMNRHDFASNVPNNQSALNIRSEYFLRNYGLGK